MRLRSSPERMEANPRPIGMTRIGSTRARESFQRRNDTDVYIWMLFGLGFVNDAFLSITCCGPPFVLSTLKV